jgi:hypothetical protein
MLLRKPWALGNNVGLSARDLTLTIEYGVPGAQFCQLSCLLMLSEQTSTRRKMTTEMLRRKHESALVWYQGFRGYNTHQAPYRRALSEFVL